MRTYSKWWIATREKMELLKKDPQEFVRCWGGWFQYKLSMADVESSCCK